MSKKNNTNFCPLMPFSTMTRTRACMREKCAWWNIIWQKCSVAVIAAALSAVMEELGKMHLEMSKK